MTYTAEFLTSRAKRVLLDFDPDTGNATLVTCDPAAAAKCVAIRDFSRVLVGVFRSVGTGGITTVRIVAATDAAGTGQTTVVEITPTTADAVGDTVWAECTAEQIHEALATATHVGVEIDLVTSTDECVVLLELAAARFEKTGLTANYIS